MEREFPLQVLEERIGSLTVREEGLYLSACAWARARGEGLCKLWLVGTGGGLLLGTLVPDRGKLCLGRRLPLDEVRRRGAWPPTGVRMALVWPFDSARPFPMPGLFCLSRVEQGRLLLEFDGAGTPVLPGAGEKIQYVQNGKSKV